MEIEQAIILIEENFKKFNLKDWSYKFNNSKRRVGVCKYNKKCIEFSRWFVEGNEQTFFIDTLLHEIAHAVVGINHNHNKVWRMKAVEIGCSGERVCKNTTNKPAGRYIYCCPNCKKQYHFYRLPKYNKTFACSYCCKGVWKKEYILERIK